MAGPKPAPTDSEAETETETEADPDPEPEPPADDGPATPPSEPDDPDPIEQATEQRLDQIDAGEPVRKGMHDDPFDDTDDADVDLAEVDIGEPAAEQEPDTTTDTSRSQSQSQTPSQSNTQPAPDDPFDGTEDTGHSGQSGISDFGAAPDGSRAGAGPDPSGGDGMGEDAQEFMQAASSTVNDDDLDEVINSGFARLAVIGLDDEFLVNGSVKSKQDLQDEFEEVFETFRLGKYGSQAAREYLFVNPENINPLWGFTASMVACTALVVWMRPDGDELVSSVTNATGNPLEDLL